MTGTYIAAIDPGKDKVGLALVGSDGRVVEQLILAPDAVSVRLKAWQQSYPVDAVVLGDRTRSADFRRRLAAEGVTGAACPLVTVDEHLSTQEARRRYLEANPGRGLARLLPVSLRTPDRPVDDYVAVILAERYLGRKSISRNLWDR
jgi:RNase H-fold protein (predicted Holliday junction resolvase)